MIVRFAIPFFIIVAFVLLPLTLYGLSRWLLPRRYGQLAGILLAAADIVLAAYGMTAGFRPLVVRHIEFASTDLPAAFDGYRIVHFSDAHVGTLTGSRESLIPQLIDSINGQTPDMIVFTGDMQNIRPEELIPPMLHFRRLYAPDGVYAVLGNHDYATYQTGNEKEKVQNCQLTQDIIRKMGFDLLLNEHRTIRLPKKQRHDSLASDSDSIVLGGMENWGTAQRMPRRGDVRQTLAGLSGRQPFTIMLQHDPTCWRQKILPECHAQLTLSGHTHGGQFSLLGWSPAALVYDEWQGLTMKKSRGLLVTTGAGSLIPFRLNQPREIVVITLKRKH
jgi:predicted MPP superfamily phosphohydrolase